MQRPSAVDGTAPPMYVRHLPLFYPVTDWNVHKLTLDGGSLTIWCLIDNLMKDDISTVVDIAMEERGQPSKKQQRLAVKRQQEKLLYQLNYYIFGCKNIGQFLSGFYSLHLLI